MRLGAEKEGLKAMGLKMGKKIRRFSVVIYWLVLLALLVLFFTNDFGLVDIHKTSIITAVGIDVEEGEVLVTAQIAVPQPSQSGDNVQYTEVQGSGYTVSDALNEINSKTGFYPKLLFCKLILLGDSCKDEELFRILGCFYRKNYSELTVQVAMCKGKAADMLATEASLGEDMNVEALNRILSPELVKSANVSAVNLKDIAMTNFSVSAACYMPYIIANKSGTSESGDDKVGGEQTGGGSESSGSSGESGSGGSSGEESGGGSSGGGSGSSQQSGGNGGQKAEFTSRKTAIFADGKFKGILDERQSFALNILENDIRLAVVPCVADGVNYTVGLKNAGGGVSLKIENGEPLLKLSFSAKAQIQGAKEEVDPNETSKDDLVPENVLKGAEDEIISRMEELISVIRENDCDILGVRQLLFKFNNKYYEEMTSEILSRMKVEYEVKIKSVN